MKSIKAEDYHWTRSTHSEGSPLALMSLMKHRHSVADVEIVFNHDKLDYKKNGDAYYIGGFGGLHPEWGETAAVELNDGDILYCVMKGKEHADTFQSGEDVHMVYFLLTPLNKICKTNPKFICDCARCSVEVNRE